MTLQQARTRSTRYEAERERSGPVTTAPGVTPRLGRRAPTTASRRRRSRWRRRGARPPRSCAGDETVLDAGCGSGRVTAMLLDRLPRGPRGARSTGAVDGRARARGARRDARVTVLQADLMELELARARRRRLLERGVPLDPRPRRASSPACTPPCARAAGSSRSAAGEGNVERFRRLAARWPPSRRTPSTSTGWAGPWNFAGPEQTAERLERRRLRGGRDLARALAGDPGRPARVPAHRLPRLPPGAAAGGAARAATWRRCCAIRRPVSSTTCA